MIHYTMWLHHRKLPITRSPLPGGKTSPVKTMNWSVGGSCYMLRFNFIIISPYLVLCLLQKCFRCMLLFGFTGLAVGFFLLGPSPFLNFLPAQCVIDMTPPCYNSRKSTVVKCYSPFTMWSPYTWAHRHICLGWVMSQWNLCGKCLTSFEIIQKLFRLEIKISNHLRIWSVKTTRK